MPNSYCDPLGIAPPQLERMIGHREANTFALLLLALLERGGPMTLEQIAERLAHAGAGGREQLLASLKRCRPARPPVYRDGEIYSLDPYDDELDLWAFRLDLRPPRVQPPPRPAPPTPPTTSDDEPLTMAELEAAWVHGVPYGSSLRLAIAVLDACGGAATPETAIERLASITPDHFLRKEAAAGWRQRCVTVAVDGTWVLDQSHADVRKVRGLVRERVALEHNRKWQRATPEEIRQNMARYEERRQAHAAELARLRTVLLHGVASGSDRVVVMIDVSERRLETRSGDCVSEVAAVLAGYDIIAAIDVRTQLRSLGLTAGNQRLVDLAPPQKTRHVGRRSLKLTPSLLLRGTCGLTRPLAATGQLAELLARGQHRKLTARLEGDAKALYAMYRYGRLHGCLRLRSGMLDERLPVPWVSRDEPSLIDLLRAIAEADALVEFVAGKAPSWDAPWGHVQPGFVVLDEHRWPYLFTLAGSPVPLEDVQAARVCTSPPGREGERSGFAVH